MPAKRPMPAKRMQARPRAEGARAVSAHRERAAASPAGAVCLGRIVGAHGVRGIARIKSYTAEPDDLTAYGALSDECGTRRFAVTVTGRAKGVLLARIDGVDDRDAAEALVGTELYVAREALPPTEGDEYYHVDLIGLRAETEAGIALGRVSAIHDHGAGPIVEIQPPEGPSALVPFTREQVPRIDIEAGRMVVVAPEEVS